MAPEQLQGRVDVGAAADVYAVGLLLFEAATGEVPHRRPTMSLLVKDRLSGDVPALEALRPDLPARFVEVVRCCLQVPLDGRYPSGAELRAALEAPPPAPAPAALEATPAIVVAPRRRRAWLVAPLLALLGGVGWWWSGRLPSGERRIAITVRAGGDAWLERAVANQARRRLAGLPGTTVSTSAAGANVSLALEVRKHGEQVVLAGALGPTAGRRSQLPEQSGASVAVALDALLAPVRDRLADHAPSAVASPERAARLGARSGEAHRLYEQAIDQFFGTVVTDTGAVRALATRARALDPGWAHPHVLLALVEGSTSPAARQALKAGLRQVTELARDRSGGLLLVALEATGDPTDERLAALDAAFRADSADVLLGWTLSELLVASHRAGAHVEVLQRLFAARPDLQFGSDLATALADAGRGAEVPELLRGWLERAPDSEQALAALAARALSRGEVADADRWLGSLLLLHGQAPHRKAMLCDAHLAGLRTDAARRCAEELLQSNEPWRTRARRRLGEVAILEGRFAAAEEALRASVESGRPQGVEGDLALSLQALRGLSALLDRPAEVGQYTGELARVLDDVGDASSAALVRFEDALASRGSGPCPDLDRALAPMREGAARLELRRHLVRVAAAARCVSCAEAVRLGLSTEERVVSDPSPGGRGEAKKSPRIGAMAAPLPSGDGPRGEGKEEVTLTRNRARSIPCGLSDRIAAKAPRRKQVAHGALADRRSAQRIHKSGHVVISSMVDTSDPFDERHRGELPLTGGAIANAAAGELRRDVVAELRWSPSPGAAAVPSRTLPWWSSAGWACLGSTVGGARPSSVCGGGQRPVRWMLGVIGSRCRPFTRGR